MQLLNINQYILPVHMVQSNDYGAILSLHGVIAVDLLLCVCVCGHLICVPLSSGHAKLCFLALLHMLQIVFCSKFKRQNLQYEYYELQMRHATFSGVYLKQLCSMPIPKIHSIIKTV